MVSVSELDGLRIVALVGWLVLAGSALAAYRLAWKKAVVMALVWVAIFGGVALAISALT